MIQELLSVFLGSWGKLPEFTAYFDEKNAIHTVCLHTPIARVIRNKQAETGQDLMKQVVDLGGELDVKVVFDIGTFSAIVYRVLCEHKKAFKTDSDSVRCCFCGSDRGWWCPESPDNMCDYDQDDGGWDPDQCRYCGQPEERK